MSKILRFSDDGKFLFSNDGQKFSEEIPTFEFQKVTLNRENFDAFRRPVSSLLSELLSETINYEDVVSFLQENEEDLTQDQVQELLDILSRLLTEEQLREIEERLREIEDIEEQDLACQIDIISGSTNLDGDNLIIYTRPLVTFKGRPITEGISYKWSIADRTSRNVSFFVSRGHLESNQIYLIKLEVFYEFEGEILNASSSLPISTIGIVETSDELARSLFFRASPTHIQYLRSGETDYTNLVSHLDFFGGAQNNLYEVEGNQVTFRVTSSELQVLIIGENEWRTIIRLDELFNLMIQNDASVPPKLERLVRSGTVGGGNNGVDGGTGENGSNDNNETEDNADGSGTPEDLDGQIIP